MFSQDWMNEVVGWIGIVLWLCFIISGLFYLWSHVGPFTTFLLFSLAGVCTSIDVYNNKDEIFK